MNKFLGIDVGVTTGVAFIEREESGLFTYRWSTSTSQRFLETIDDDWCVGVEWPTKGSVVTPWKLLEPIVNDWIAFLQPYRVIDVRPGVWKPAIKNVKAYRRLLMKGLSVHERDAIGIAVWLSRSNHCSSGTQLIST